LDKQEINKKNESYRNAGVDIHAGYEAVSLMKKHIQSTMRPGVISKLGGFSAMFSLNAFEDFAKMRSPVLVSGTDGVGTKIKIADIMNRHNTIGIDCVAMCVNDIITSGATPLFFLDYIACGKVIPEKIEAIVEGISQGCIQSGMALIGGETAEHPGIMPDDDYDLAGFAVGIVDEKEIISNSDIKAEDVLIGIASSGVHSNGFSLIRKVLQSNSGNINNYISELGTTLGDELLRPTRIYVKSILGLIKNIRVKGLCHITGGGFYENVPRMFPEGIGGIIKKNSWEELPIFGYLEKTGKISRDDMLSTFNMGIGMIAAVESQDADKTLEILRASGEKAFVIGHTIVGEGLRFE